MNFTVRLHKKEELDNLSLSGQPLQKTLSSLDFINSSFGNHRQMAQTVLDYCHQFPDTKKFHIVDLGCGGGDLMYYISQKLRKRGIQHSFLGIDGNPETIRFARSHNKLSKDMNFLVADILDPNFGIPYCDILISSHFIYHFEDTELVQFLNKALNNNIPCIIWSELYRSKWAYWIFTLTKELLPISNIAKRDGALAIRRAYTLSELDEILQKSQALTYTIQKKPWFRSITKISNIC